MACVDKLREELMESLGIGVERKRSSPPSVANPRRDLIGSARRDRTSRCGSSSSSRGMVEYPQNARRLQQQPLTQQQEHYETGGRRSSSTHDRRVGEKYARPGGMNLRATSNNRSSGRGGVTGGGARPATASSARSIKRTEIDVLMEICRDQGRGFSLDPADFDSSVSAICNLPVGPFVGAASAGWGTYFRDLHCKMRARERTASTLLEKPHFERKRTPATHSRRRLRQLVPSTVKGGRDIGGDSKPPERTHSRRRREDLDSLAASRARAAKRAAEEDVTRRMAIRLQTLWLELKIPETDRAYIVATYLDPGFGTGLDGRNCDLGDSGEKGDRGPTSAEVQRELARQIALLLEHRAATIKVLHAVNLREARLTEVEHALASFQWHRGLDTDAVGLVASLAGLRDASLDVVRSVKEWRQNLWQPRAFCWRGENYLQKMSRDAGFLLSPIGRNLLSSVGLEVSDMTFIIFQSTDGDSTCSSESHGPETHTADDVQPPPSIVRLTPKAELVAEYRSRFFEQSPATEAAEGWDKGVVDGTRSPGTGTMLRGVELVVQERALQRRVRTERTRLATKGCFVPLLRWLPGDKNSSRDRRRSSYSDRKKGSHETREGVSGPSQGAGGVAESPPTKASATPTPPPPMTETKTALAVSDVAVADVRQLGDSGTKPDRRSVEGGTDDVSLPGGGGNQGEHELGDMRVREPLATSRGEKHKEGEEEEEEDKEEQEGEERGLAGRKQELHSSLEGGGSRFGPNNSSGYTGEGGVSEGRAPPQNKTMDKVPIGLRDEPRRPPEGKGSSEDSTEGGQGSASRMDGKVPSMGEIDGRSSGDEVNKTSDEATAAVEGVPLMEQGTDHEVPIVAPHTTHIAYPSKEERLLHEREAGSSPMVTINSTDIISGEGPNRHDGQLLGINVKTICAGQNSENENKRGETEVEDQSWDDAVSQRGEGDGGSGSGGGGGGYTDVDETTQVLRTPSRREDYCEDNSVAASLYYDDDFEDDGQEFYLSGSNSGSGRTSPGPGSVASGMEETQTASVYLRTDESILPTAVEDLSRVDGSAAAVVVQSAWRRTAAVGKVQHERRQRRQRADKEGAAATRIQQVARAALEDKLRYRHRRRTNDGQEGGGIDSRQQEDSAKKLQSWFFDWRTKRDSHVRRTSTDAAVRIQSAVRRKRASDEVREFRRGKENRKIDSAVIIQAAARGRQQRALARPRKEEQACRVEKSEPAIMTRLSTSGNGEARPDLAAAVLEETRRPQQSTSEMPPVESGETSGQAGGEQAKVGAKAVAATSCSPSSEGRATRDSPPVVAPDNRRSNSPTSRGSSSSLTCAGLSSTSGTGTGSGSSSTGSGSGSYSSSGTSSSLDGASISDNSSAEIDDKPPYTERRHQKAAAGKQAEGLSGEVGSPGVERTTAERVERERGGVIEEAGVVDRNNSDPNLRQPDDGGLVRASDNSQQSLHVGERTLASETREEERAAHNKAGADGRDDIMCDVGIANGFVGLVPVPEDKRLLGTTVRSGSEYENDFEVDALSSASAASPGAVEVGDEARTRSIDAAARVATKDGTVGDEGKVGVPESGEARGVDGGGSCSEGSMLTLSVTSSD